MAAAEDAGSIYSEVRIKLDKLSGDIRAVNSRFDQLGKDLQRQGTKTQNSLAKSFSAIGLSGAAAIGVVTLAFKSAVRTFAETEQSLANVRAVSNATEQEFKLLSDAAAEAGTTTRFTASEAADALFFLSSAGLSATQSVDALSGVLELAGATGADLSQSAQTITATLSQFSLEASKAADVSNVFAAANSNSQATLSRLQNALRQVGSVAGAFDVGLEEVVGSLQALFNAGFEGEAAGRALKNALADLGNESSSTNKKLAELGISFEDVNPEVVGLTGAIGTLERAGLSTAQVLDIFGKEAGPQLVTLLKTGEQGLRDYEAAVTGTSEATRQYATQNDTLAGSLDSLKSALEGTGNVFIGKIAPYLREVVDLTTDLTRFTGDLGKETESTGKKIFKFAASFLNPISAIKKLTLETSKWLLNLSRSRRESEELEKTRLAELFGGIGESAGLANEELDSFLKTAGDVENALTEIFNQEGATFEDVKDQVDLLNSSLGLSQEQIIEIALKSEGVTDEYKLQLETLKDQITELKVQNQYVDSWLAKEIEREAVAARAAAELERQAQAEQDRLNEQIRKELAIAQIINTIQNIRSLEAEGLISTEESLDRQIEYRESLLDSYKEQAIADGGLTDEIIENIRNQEYWLNLLYSQKEELSNKASENETGNQDEETENLKRNSTAKVSIYQEELSKRESALRNFESKKAQIRAEEAEAEEEARQARLNNWNDYYSRIASFATDLFSVLADLALKNAELEIAEINNKLEADLSAIDSRTQATLESLGLQEETKAETLQREIEEAKTAGDLELANEKQKELDRLNILSQAAEEKAILEQDAARKTAKLQYQADLAAWRLEKASALVLASQAILQGYAQLGPIGGSIAATGTAILTGAQISLINKNKPEPPALQTGGIVLPRPGGTVARLAENGSPELNLNAGAEGQQLLGQFASQIVGKMGGGQTVILNIDGKVLAKHLADNYFSSAVVTIDGRGIR